MVVDVSRVTTVSDSRPTTVFVPSVTSMVAVKAATMRSRHCVMELEPSIDFFKVQLGLVVRVGVAKCEEYLRVVWRARRKRSQPRSRMSGWVEQMRRNYPHVGTAEQACCRTCLCIRSSPWAKCILPLDIKLLIVRIMMRHVVARAQPPAWSTIGVLNSHHRLVTLGEELALLVQIAHRDVDRLP